MFVVQDNKAVFVPVKTGIAGEKYFEVLSGLKEGEQVIIGPFARCASSPTARPSRSTRRADDAGTKTQAVNQFLEAAVIALSAIWANKLRSFLTVLGNIVAVTSIIAVVSLIQGMNALRHRRDRLRRRRRQLHDPADAGRPHAGGRGARPQQPAHHAAGRRRGPEVQRATSARSPRRPTSARAITYRNEALDSVAGPGRVARLHLLLDVQRRARPADQPGRGRPRPAGRRCSAGDVADQLFGPADPIDKVITIGSLHFRVVGVSEKKGSVVRQVAGRVRDHPARRVPEDVRLAAFGLQLLVKPKTPRARQGGDGRRDGGDADRAAAAAERAATTSACSRRTRCSASTTRRPTASSPCSSASSRCRSSSAASSS